MTKHCEQVTMISDKRGNIKKNKLIAIILICSLCVGLLSGCEEKTAISPKDFESILEENDCIIEEQGSNTRSEELPVILNGMKETHCFITYYGYDNKRDATKFYNDYSEHIRSCCGSTSKRVRRINYKQCSGTDDLLFYYISEVGNTIICAVGNLDYQDDANVILEQLGV